MMVSSLESISQTNTLYEVPRFFSPAGRLRRIRRRTNLDDILHTGTHKVYIRTRALNGDGLVYLQVQVSNPEPDASIQDGSSSSLMYSVL